MSYACASPLLAAGTHLWMWVRAWEAQADACLPLCAVQDELLSDESALRLLMFLGLVEEDARFGLLFEALQGIPGQQRPTLGYLMSAWQGALLVADDVGNVIWRVSATRPASAP